MNKIAQSLIHIMNKIAFGPEQAQKVLSIAKKLQLPKASRKVIDTGTGAIPGSKTVMGRGRNSLKSLGIKPELHDSILQDVLRQAPVDQQAALRIATKLDPSGKTGVILPGYGETHISKLPHRVRDMAGTSAPGPAFNPANSKMYHAIVKGHELDELKVRGGMSAVQFGHASPDVLFREHNRVTTLPAGYEGAKRCMIEMRTTPNPIGTTEAGSFFPKQIPYGTGPRLSRHARKHLTRISEDKAIQIARSQVPPEYLLNP